MITLQENKLEQRQIRFFPIQEKTLDLCPQCGSMEFASTNL